jgi:hypothetical protein
MFDINVLRPLLLDGHRYAAQPCTIMDTPVPDDTWMMVAYHFTSWGDVLSMMQTCRANLAWWLMHFVAIYRERPMVWHHVHPSFPTAMDPACVFGAHCVNCRVPFRDNGEVVVFLRLSGWSLFTAEMGTESKDATTCVYTMDIHDQIDFLTKAIEARNRLHPQDQDTAGGNTFMAIPSTCCSIWCAERASRLYAAAFPRCPMCGEEVSADKFRDHFNSECRCRYMALRLKKIRRLEI